MLQVSPMANSQAQDSRKKLMKARNTFWLSRISKAVQAQRRRKISIVLLSAVCWISSGLLGAAICQAQQNLQYTKNNRDLGMRSDLHIDPATLGMSVMIPLANYPGRAGNDFPVALYYNSKVWRLEYDDYVNGNMVNCVNNPVIEVGTECYTTTRALYAEQSVAGWTFSSGFPTIETGGERYSINGSTCCNGDPNQGYYIARLTVRFPNGATHELRRSDAVLSGADPYTGTYYAVDSSRLKYVATQAGTGNLYLPNGSRYEVQNGSATRLIDRNGNIVLSQTDTLGRQIAAPAFHNGSVHSETHSLPGLNGAPLDYTFELQLLQDVLEPDLITGVTPPLHRLGDMDKFGTSIHSPSLFQSEPGSRVIDGALLFNPVVLRRIILPNGTSYTFGYNQYGEITRVVLPTGGYERFRYGSIAPLAAIGSPYAQANRGVLERRVSASGSGSDEVIWSYSSTGTVVTTTAPDGTRTVRYLMPSTPSGTVVFGLEDPRSGMIYEERIYQSAAQGGAMLRRMLSNWDYSGPLPGGQPSAKRNPRVNRQVEIILDTGGDALATTTEMTYDADLNVTSTRRYNFVSLTQATAQTAEIVDIPNGALRRTQETDYLTDDPNYRDRHLLALPVATRVRDAAGNLIAQSSISYDETAFPLLTYGPVTGWLDPATNVRGNATTVSTWLNTTNSNLPTHTQYDQCGSVRNVWDARDTNLNNPARIEYAATYQRAYPTSSSSADPDEGGPLQALTTTTEFDLATGLITAQVDENGQRTSFGYNDPLNRLKQVIRAETDPQAKSQTTYNYNDTARTLTVTTDLNLFNDNTLKTMVVFDGLGRATETRAYESATNYIATKTEYDALGRPFKTSNPFRPWLSETAAWTTQAFDALGRVISVTSPDSAAMTTSYSANTVTITDQAGKKRKSITDSLGRLIEVIEDPSPGLDYHTTYNYDALDNLTTVTQGTQTRSFVYDSLKRLRSATNPESGTVTYEYDVNSNLTKKTDARGIDSTYEYDALNRNITINYSDTTISPDVTRSYDGASNGKGRLWISYKGGDELTGSNVEKTVFDGYDALGRPLVLKQFFKLNNVWKTEPYRIARTYNRAGGVSSQTYPSDRFVTYNYDSAGRLADKDAQNLAFTGNLGDGVLRTYSRGISYASAGQLKQEQFGTTTAVYNKLFYNSRQQLAEILASTTGGDSSWNRGKIINSYSLQCAGAGCNATDNNGNLRKQEVTIPVDNQDPTSWYQQYDYDALNRLLRVHENTGTPSLDWQQEYVYDRWGNRTIHQTNTYGTGINKKDFTVNTANNRLGVPAGQSGVMSYDAAGNLSTDSYTGFGNRVYDAENKMTAAQDNSGVWSYYTYNADGQRTRRKISNQETWQVYGFDGELLAEYPANAAANQPTKEYGYRNGQLLISAEAGNASAPAAFADDFNDNLLNANSWSVYYPGLTPTVSEQFQQLQITLSPNTTAYNGVYSNSTYDLTNKMVQVESVQAVSQAGWCENYLEVELNANNYFLIQVGAGNMIFRSRVNGVNDQTSIPFDAAANRFWRIRHDQSANQIYFETSADDSVWLTRKTVTPGFSLTSLRFHLLAGAYGNGNSSPGAAKYDNFKLLASSAGPVSLSVPNAGFETPVLGNGNFQYSPSGGSWSFANGGGISGMNSPFTGVPSVAPDGAQVAFLQATGTISQSISGFQASANYVITFSAIQRTNCCNTTGQDIGVYIDSTLVGTFHPGNTAYVEYSTTPFTTTTGAHTVKFAGLNGAAGGETAFIDKVRITGTPKPGYGVQWLIADQLGTPRMVFDESGVLANVKRHDYLPFGEELFAPQGLRSATLGYSGSDGLRHQFTQKERDIETGLDYFDARYYGSTQGRFTSPDPYNPIVDSEEEEDFSQYLGQPQNWNRYVYVWNNPLRYIDPNGEKVYVVTYTYGNSEGDDEFRRAAETREQQIRNSKGFDPKKDTVLLAAVKTKEDFAGIIKEANGLQKQYGKVEQISLYSHAGRQDGPVFHDQGGNPTQFSQRELSNLRVNWSASATARFYGCYTGMNFAQNFANAQRVPGYGYDRYAYFSTSPDKRTSNDTGRLYFIATDGYENGTWLKYMRGNSESYPMVRRNPAPPPRARPSPRR